MKKKKGSEPTLMLTSMVDILFMMLIFFVLVSSIKKDSVDVNTPKVNKNNKSKPSSTKTEQHTVTIDNKNNIYVNGKQVNKPEDLQALLGEIKQKTAKDTTPMILLRPDTTSQSSKLIEIFAVLNNIGLSENVQIEVEKK